MNILNNIGILINALSIAASLTGFILSFHLLVKDREEHNRVLARRYLALFIFCSVVLFSSGFFYTKRITTLKQAGYFYGNNATTNEIFYPIPYRANPNLSFNLFRRGGPSGAMSVLEQRADGFKAQTGGRLTEHWEWEADGIPIEITNKDAAVGR